MLNGKRVVGIIQARMGSTRLPGKVVKDLLGRPLLMRIVERVEQSKLMDDLIIATSTCFYDDIIEMLGEMEGVTVFRGSEEDVLDRYYRAAQINMADIVVRICADNPLTEPRFIDMSVEQLLNRGADYIYPEGVPLGTNVWTFTFSALEVAALNSREAHEREHVVPYLHNHPEIFNIQPLCIPLELRRPDIHISVDTMDDYLQIFRLFYYFRERDLKSLPLEGIIKYLDSKNCYRLRPEGSLDNVDG